MHREVSIDVAKGIAIILVVVGHTIAAYGGEYKLCHNFIYAFHMPLFLGISGMFVSTNNTMSDFIRNRLIRFMLPFVFYILFYYIFSLCMNIAKSAIVHVYTVNEAPRFINIVEVLHTLAMANYRALYDSKLYLPLWFLPVAFSLSVVCRILNCTASNKISGIRMAMFVIVSWSIVAINNSLKIHDEVPWGLDISLMCLPFVGVLDLRKYLQRLPAVSLTFFFGVSLLLSIDMSSGMGGMRIENYPKFLLAAVSGIILVVLVSFKLQSLAIGIALSAIGRRSFIIYALHGLFIDLWKPIASRAFLFCGNDIIELFAACLGISLPFLMYPIVRNNKILRFVMLGESEKKSIGVGARHWTRFQC